MKSDRVREEDKTLLPIRKISNEVKSFKKELRKKLDSFPLNIKKHQIMVLKKTLEEMSEALIDQVDNFPIFKVDAVFVEEAILDDEKQVIDKQVSAVLSERERSLAALRDALGEVEDKHEAKKDERLLIEVATQGKMAELRVEQEVEEKTNFFTRACCCLFPQAKEKLDNLNSLKIQKQKENEAALQKIEEEKEELKREAENKAAADYAGIQEKIGESIDVIKARAVAKVKAERGYEAYKYTITEDMMLLFIRLNSCVRRIGAQFSDFVKKNTNENTPLNIQDEINQMKGLFGRFDLDLGAQCKLLYCVDPDDDTHKIDFSDFYRRFHKLGEKEKQAIVDGNIPENTRNMIFSWEIPQQVLLQVTAPPALNRSSSRRF